MTARILHGDCLDVLRSMSDCSVDAVVTDPPAGIAFMGKAWDGDKGGRDLWIAWLAERLAECLRVLKPGGHAVVWALPRTSGWTHRALEDAGFDVRDCVHHLFGSGFPKSLDVGKAIDKAAGAEREVVGRYVSPQFAEKGYDYDASRASERHHAESRTVTGFAGETRYGWDRQVTAPATAEAQQWSGWGTALKPAVEHWWLARKPLDSTVAGTVTRWGTGALNIDGTRVAHGTDVDLGAVQRQSRTAGSGWDSYQGGIVGKEIQTYKPSGRWPADVVLTHSTIAWYTLRRDLPVDVAAATLADYGHLEEVRTLRGGVPGDALRSRQAPVLLSGLCEHCSTGSPCNAVGDDREAVRHARGGGGSLACGERLLAVPAHCIRPGTEVLFEYLDSPACDEGVCVPGCAVAELDKQSGTMKDGVAVQRNGGGQRIFNQGEGLTRCDAGYGGTGGASRFFPTFKYQAKPSTREKSAGLDDLPLQRKERPWAQSEGRQEAGSQESMPQRNTHPTVKPLELMRWLIRLVTPPGGTILDPFAGSGTTLVAATLEGFDSIGVEAEAEYLPIIEGRVRWAERQTARPEQLALPAPQLALPLGGGLSTDEASCD